MAKFKCVQTNDLHETKAPQPTTKTSTAAATWERYGTGYRIQDLNAPYHRQALTLLEKYYLPNDYVCKSFGLASDRASIDSFLDRARFHIEHDDSLIVVDERTDRDELAALLISRAIDKCDYARTVSRTSLARGAAAIERVAFQQTVCGHVDLYDVFDCDRILFVYYVCVKPKFRRKGYVWQLMRAAFDVARSRRATALTGVFDNARLRRIAKDVGLGVVKEFDYDDWNRQRGDAVFDTREETKCSLMGCFVEEEPLPTAESAEDAPRSKMDDKKRKGKKGGKSPRK